MMQVPSFKEDHISQIPALEMLMKLGYEYLSPDEALKMRGGKTNQVILEDILRKKLKEINSIKVSSTKTSFFSDSNIENGILALKEINVQNDYNIACQTAYNLLIFGKTLEQSIDGDKKSFTLNYVDWENIQNNAFHVTEEFSVMRSQSREHYRPDIVLFVNGIPLGVIECKRPDMKEPLEQAISQHLRNQQEEGIRSLYVYAQILLSIATSMASYATTTTPKKFWAAWEEKFTSDTEANQYEQDLYALKNQPLSSIQKKALFSERFRYVRTYFEELEAKEVALTLQDRYLWGLCSPKRLLDFTKNFIIFEAGEKKIARYQQFFAIKKTLKQIAEIRNGKRLGGVIWHTQGSGKSLTMVLLAQAIALEKGIKNPKIVLVTDRTDLDDQITHTFKKCGLNVENATTGQNLVDLLQRKSDDVITTIINKFETAVKKIAEPLESPNIFVLVDEGHRTQHGIFNIEMQKTMPNACYIAFTGTPLFKKDKNTLKKFGTLIDDYTVDKAVKDGAVVPLLYEGRHAFQRVNEKPIDNYFNLISKSLSDKQKVDLKKKFSRAEQLNVAEQKIYAICWDISEHFRSNFQDKTPFKGQLVCQSKEAAITYKNFLDEIGIVTSEVVISPPDEREGEESAFDDSPDKVKAFWKKMMNEHGNHNKYEKNIINRFKNQKAPEIIIVVDKLITGFDVPQNIVLYLTRKLSGHTLLQAIARVNRVYPDKDFGYIIDYYGVLGELDTALETYSSFQEFDAEDLAGTLTDISQKSHELPQKHSELWDLFKSVSNKKDAEAYQVLLRDEFLRTLFYDRLSAYAKTLKVALSSLEFYQQQEEKAIQAYKEDLGFFMKLRQAVIQRYSDAIDYKQYEGQIQKLIDTHIQTDEIKPITELVNIFDKEKFQEEVAKSLGNVAKADLIASRTAKHIAEKMEEDPAFYKKFSDMLKETIEAYEQQRIHETQYLQKVQEIMETVLFRKDTDIPPELAKKDIARAFFGVSRESLSDKITDKELLQTASLGIALASDELIKSLLVIDWQNKIDIARKMIHLIGDYLIDEVRDKYNLTMSFEEIDIIAERIVDIAKIRYKQ